jgi:hypothetical protein
MDYKTYLNLMESSSIDRVSDKKHLKEFYELK